MKQNLTNYYRLINRLMKSKLSIPVPRNHPDYFKYYRELRGIQIKNKQKEWANANRDKETARWRKWYSTHQKERYAQTQLDKAEKLKRMPAWADKDAIRQFYLNCPKGYHVDHIIPLKGKIVSGFHILENLQYLPAKENLAKSNTFVF